MSDPEHATIDQGPDGRWRAACARCGHVAGGIRTREEAARFAGIHQLHHRRRGLYR